MYVPNSCIMKSFFGIRYGLTPFFSFDSCNSSSSKNVNISSWSTCTSKMHTPKGVKDITLTREQVTYPGWILIFSLATHTNYVKWCLLSKLPLHQVTAGTIASIELSSRIFKQTRIYLLESGSLVWSIPCQLLSSFSSFHFLPALRAWLALDILTY